MGHRLIAGCSDRCAIPHGHNEYVSVTLGAGLNNPQAAQLDGHANMLLPFAEAKGRWHRFIDERMDHAFQLGENDPLLAWFAENEPSRMDRIVVTPPAIPRQSCWQPSSWPNSTPSLKNKATGWPFWR